MATTRGRDLFELFATAQQACSGTGVPLARLSAALDDDDSFAVFCIDRVGVGSEGDPRVTEELLHEVSLFFGREERVVLMELQAVTSRDCFVSSEAVFEQHCRKEGPRDGRVLFGFCFADKAPSYVQLRWDASRGLDRQLFQRCELESAIKAAQGQGWASVPQVQWGTKLNRRALQRRHRAEAHAYGRGQHLPAAAPAVKQTQQASTPAAAQSVVDKATPELPGPIWAHLSGHSYCFVREVRTLFPDATRADWTALLQWVLGLPDSTAFAREEKRRVFTSLRDMFVQTCIKFAELLIDESFLPEAQRTLKPVIHTTMGISGGLMFRQHGEGTLLFKLAQDVQLSSGRWLFGGHARDHRLAMKSAGHELKSARALGDAGVSLISYPMMAAFTYRGRRVLCTSSLPQGASLVQGQDTISGLVKRPPPRLESVIQSMATRLCIAKSRKPGEEIYGPYDMKIYEAAGALYMLDAARLFPPEYRTNGDDTPPPAAHHLQPRLLRPELLRKAGNPLVPDALRYRDEAAQCDLAAVSNMLDEEISLLARDLAQGQNVERLVSREAIKGLFHSRGLNMRHLREVVQLLDAGSATRCQLQFAIDWRPPAGETVVKTLMCPQPLSQALLRSTLALQQLSLGDGETSMHVIPTLLRLADAVGDSVPLLKEEMACDEDSFRPAGEHPLVEA
jgi:hypothetical protein